MPLLATWIGSLVTSLAGFFATCMTKRVAILLAVMTFLAWFFALWTVISIAQIAFEKAG
jgi:hypothetical protein